MVYTIKNGDFENEYFTFGKGNKPFVIIPGVSLKSIIESEKFVEKDYGIFSEEYKVYVFDRRENLTKNDTVYTMADDLIYCLDYLKIKDAFFLGVSQGGMIAQVVATKRGDLVKKLVLASTLSRGNNISLKTFNKWKSLIDSGDIQKVNHEVFNCVYSKELLEKRKRVFSYIEKEGTKEELARFDILVSACRDFDIYDNLGKINCPTLVIGSNKDRVSSVKGSREIAGKLKKEKKNVELFVYNNYSHALYDEAPDFKEKVFDFFNK